MQAPESQMVTVASQKQVLVEFDCNAFFETMKKKKKMVEFYGFDVIWKRISNLQQLPELSLEGQTISCVGQEGFLSNMMTNLR